MLNVLYLLSLFTFIKSSELNIQKRLVRLKNGIDYSKHIRKNNFLLESQLKRVKEIDFNSNKNSCILLLKSSLINLSGRIEPNKKYNYYFEILTINIILLRRDFYLTLNRLLMRLIGGKMSQRIFLIMIACRKYSAIKESYIHIILLSSLFFRKIIVDDNQNNKSSTFLTFQRRLDPQIQEFNLCLFGYVQKREYILAKEFRHYLCEIDKNSIEELMKYRKLLLNLINELLNSRNYKRIRKICKIFELWYSKTKLESYSTYNKCKLHFGLLVI